jgi:hypothetical protein
MPYLSYASFEVLGADRLVEVEIGGAGEHVARRCSHLDGLGRVEVCAGVVGAFPLLDDDDPV